MPIVRRQYSVRCAICVGAAENGRELACGEWLDRQRGERREDVLWRTQRDLVEDLDHSPLAWIAGATTSGCRLRAADVILTQEQHLDREVRVGQQRGERYELVEHRRGGRALRRPADAEHLAVLIDPDDSALGGNRVDDPHAVLVEQRVELLAECGEASRLHLDQLAVGANEVDHEPSYWHLEAVAGLRQRRLYRGVQRALTQHADTRHGRRG